MNVKQQQTEHLEYLMTIGRGGEVGMASLIKSPEDEATYRRHIEWIAEAIREEQHARSIAMSVGVCDGIADGQDGSDFGRGAEQCADSLHNYIPDAYKAKYPRGEE